MVVLDFFPLFFKGKKDLSKIQLSVAGAVVEPAEK
jgi:hypothetical protein